MSETDEAVAAARAASERIRGGSASDVPLLRARRRQARGPLARLVAIGGANLVILLGAIVVGMMMPIGMFGALAVVLMMVAATLAIAFAPAARPPSPERLRAADIRTLPSQTERWLAAQRPALPAPAQTLVDRIGVQLDGLAPQLATLDADGASAQEIRKLVGEQLPEFVRGYRAVPKALRTVPRNGRTPDAQLLDGLELIEREIAGMTEQLAQGPLDALETRQRYLEIKYRGDGTS